MIFDVNKLNHGAFVSGGQSFKGVKLFGVQIEPLAQNKTSKFWPLN